MKKIFLMLIIAVLSTIRAMSAIVSDEGAWCWFADPRAVHNRTPDGRTDMTYIGYIDTHGNIKATQYDFNHHRPTEVLVRTCFQPDDHDSPTFLVIPDGRVMVFYSRHTDEPCFYYRISAIPGDITTLGEEHVIPTDHNTTYPSPMILYDDPDHFYLCWRGINWHPTIARLSLPDGNGAVEIVDGPYQIVQSTGARPYAKYTSDGHNKIHIAYTTGHPDNENPNYLYYNYIDIRDLSLRDINGRKLADIGKEVFNVDKTPEFLSSNTAMMIDASPYRDWVWQIATDKDGHPVVAMTCISPDKKSHNYYLARWDGKEWKKQFIAHAGGHFHQSPDIEHCYTAGMAINTDNTSEIYCSVPVEGANGRKYEIVRFNLDGNGEVKSTSAITANSVANNVRPYFIPSTADSPLKLAWMNGDYYDWIVSKDRPKGFPTSIVCDFNGFTPEMFGRRLSSPVQSVQPPYSFSPDEDFSISTVLDLTAEHPNGELLSLGKLKYCYDPATLFPEIKYGKKTYRSVNRLANSYEWTNQRRATDGKWYTPAPLKDIDLTLEYSDGLLSTYINGCLDQSVRLTPSKVAPKMFSVKNPDFKKSPLTGMTRRHWIEAAEYLLDGAFGYIDTITDPMYFPKQLDKTYPRDSYNVKVAKLEGLARTFFLAAPLLRENPDLTLNGIKVADYYRHHILGLIDPKSYNFEAPVSNYPSQTLLELGSLCLSLEITADVLWNTFTPEQRDALAALFKAYGEGPTIGSNWKFFNVFALSFLKKHGYEVNEDYLSTQLKDLLAMYRGEGWYNDAPAYDYYSMWAFQTYGPLWAQLFGKEQYPEYAAQFISNQGDMADNYPYMFARDGRMNMWGRSIPYRFACVAPLALTEYGGQGDINYGWLRHISSASLLQFLTNPDFLEDGVPTMGFYGPFAPAVQIYSCRGSVYWLGKAFFNLLLPEDSQYWSAVENRGPWDTELKPGKAYNRFQPATNLMITDYPDCGGAEMRSWCKEKVATDWQKFRSSENYNKLAYHTEFPWMADGPDGEVSMNYGIRNARGDWEVLRLYDFVDFADGVYRRDAVLETDENVKVQLADIPLADGVLRIDKVTVLTPTDVRLGSYSLPRLSNDITEAQRGDAVEIANGEYHLASVPLYGWDETFTLQPRGLHPVSDTCSVIINEAHVDDTKVFVTLHLWQKGDGKIPDRLLHQVKSVEVSPGKTNVTVTLSDGSRKAIQFNL